MEWIGNIVCFHIIVRVPRCDMEVFGSTCKDTPIRLFDLTNNSVHLYKSVFSNCCLL